MLSILFHSCHVEDPRTINEIRCPFITLKIVKLGETVGIIAGQSIGEPGTRITLRTTILIYCEKGLVKLV